MTDHRPPPPEPEDCLTLSRASSYKGGTLIAEDVRDLATHLRRLADPDGVPALRVPALSAAACCTFTTARSASPAASPAAAGIRHRALHLRGPACGATWRILPAFLAATCGGSGATVERTVTARPRRRRLPRRRSPERTARRWRARLASVATQLVVLLATSGGALFEAIAKRAGLEATRSRAGRRSCADDRGAARAAGSPTSRRSSTDSSGGFVSCNDRRAPRARGTARRPRSIPPFVAAALSVSKGHGRQGEARHRAVAPRCARPAGQRAPRARRPAASSSRRSPRASTRCRTAGSSELSPRTIESWYYAYKQRRLRGAVPGHALGLRAEPRDRAGDRRADPPGEAGEASPLDQAASSGCWSGPGG